MALTNKGILQFSRLRNLSETGQEVELTKADSFVLLSLQVVAFQSKVLQRDLNILSKAVCPKMGF